MAEPLGRRLLHLEPPVEILERMLTARLHLDDCDEANGPLRVILGSQALGCLTAVEIRRRRESAPSIACLAPAGGVVLIDESPVAARLVGRAIAGASFTWSSPPASCRPGSTGLSMPPVLVA
jgi:hypothetical protein